MKLAFLSPFTTSVLNNYIPELKEQNVPQGTGGSAVFELVLGLIEQQEIELHLLTFQPGLEKTLKFTNGKISYYLIPCRLKGATRSFWKKERNAIKKTLIEIKPDVIHAHWTYEYALGALDYDKEITLITCHDIPYDVLKYSRSLYYLPKFIASHIVYRKAECFTSVSPSVLNYANKFISKSKKTFIIPNIIDVKKYNLYKLHDKYKELPKKYIISIGLWNSLKNIKIGIKAFNRLLLNNKEFENYYYLLIGKGLGKDEDAEKWAIKNKIEKNIFFIGHCTREETLNLLSKSEILLHPSKTEAFPMVIGEALYYNKIVIAGDKSGGIPWMLNKGKYGYLCDINSPEKIKNCLVSAIKNNEIHLNGCEYIQNNFSNEIILSKYFTIYELIKNKLSNS